MKMEKFDKTFFDKLLGKQSACYYAHLPKPEQTGRKPELLSEHSALTVAYAQSLANANGLNSTIEHLINDSIPSKLSQRQLLAETINKWFWRAIAFHDFGKINHLFQQNRMKNKADIVKVTHDFESQHSIISAYLYLALFFSELLSLDLSDEEQIFLSNVVLYMSCPIKQHHSAYLDDCQNEEAWCEYENNMPILSHKIEALRPYIHSLNVIVNDEVIKNMRESDIFILPSVNETFGMVYLEAMASGCITVCTKNDGIAGIIKDGENGFLTEPENINETLKKIKYFVQI